MAPDYVIFVSTLLLWLLTDVNLASELSPIVQTDKGKIRGVAEYPLGKKVDKFLGIPYARPPVGDLRFRLPVQNDPWEGVLDATHLPNSCVQISDDYFGNFTGSTMWNANTKQSEDCLYLNVWVPRTNPPYKNKSVMVFIYGGSFYSGSSTLDIYSGDMISIENDVIFVSMQYRVGALGFLTLDTMNTPGNLGLWDQRMALEWVSRNIHYFGGNPHSVTLVGESAGAVSIGLHLLCDVCRGYFHRAILQSGSPLAEWGTHPKREMWRRSENLAKRLHCYKEGDPDYMVECLRQVNATVFPAEELFVTGGIIQFGFVPVIDGVFIRQDPKELVAQGMFKKVPILLGSNSNEITFFIIYFHDSFSRSTNSEISRPLYTELVDSLFEFYPTYPVKLNRFGKDAINFHYTNFLNPDDGVAFRQSLDSAGSDCYFVCPLNRLARAYARNEVPVYYYWFDQRWSANPWPEWMGVLHGDEFWFTFGQALNETHSFTKAERLLSRAMMRYWTNFAKTGNPNKAPGESPSDEWPRFYPNEQLYLNLSTRTMASGQTWGQGPRTQHCAFWDNYLPKLVSETSDITEMEREWKNEFYNWKNRYMVDWKAQFDSFIQNYQRKTSSCSGGGSGSSSSSSSP